MHIPETPPQSGRSPAVKSAIVATILLALATFGTTWSAFQAAMWTSELSVESLRATRAGRFGTEAALRGEQRVHVDASLFYAYLDARMASRDKEADALRERFRPGLKAAVDAWLATEPFSSGSGPSGPFDMPQYVVPERAEAAALRAQEDDHLGRALVAQHNGDEYTFATTVFAGASLLAGTASMLVARRARYGAIVVAALIFVAALVWVVMRPKAFPGPMGAIPQHEFTGSSLPEP
jgi:hypothetical protein